MRYVIPISRIEVGLCNFSDVINCDIVNKSIYSEVVGIPVALLGMLFYVFMMWLSYHLAFRDDGNSISEKAIVYLSGFGVLYSLSLGIFVFYKLHAICPVCVTSYIIVIIMFILSFKIRKRV